MRRFTAFMLFISILLAACQETVPPPTVMTTQPPQILRIGVAGSAKLFADVVKEPFLETTDQAILQFVIGNSETLWAELEDGRLDAILVHHIPPGNERWFNPVALDGLMIIVHPDNPLGDLSLAEVQALFNGRIQNWQEMGGQDYPVSLISRETGSGALALLNQTILVDQRLNINAHIAPSNERILDVISGDAQAIGFSMMGHAANVKPLTIDGIEPAPQTATSQTYPLTTPLYFVHQTQAEPEDELRAFLAWLQSDDGQALIGEYYGRVR